MAIQGISPRDVATQEISRELRAPSIGTDASKKGAGPDFADALVGAFSKAAEGEQSASDLAERVATGEPNVGIHEVIIGMEKASIELKYAVTLKNKILEAYKDLMSTPV